MTAKSKPRTPQPVASSATRPSLPWTLRAPVQVSYTFDNAELECDSDDQDEIIVNTVELGPSKQSMGLQHYLEQVAEFDVDDSTHPASADYRTRNPDSYSRDENKATGSEIKHPKASGWNDQGINGYNTDMPMPPASVPPASVAEYRRQIYKAKTTDPAVYLAIIRIAQKNRPDVDFSFTVDNLPNLPPKDPLPKLKLGIMNAQHKQRLGDIEMSIVFLPCFYSDGRHALGYYALSPELDNCTWAPKQAGLFVKHDFFTPCTSWDLEHYMIVEYADGSDAILSTDGQGLDAEYMVSIGARGGKWMAWDIVEDWENWVAEFRIVKSLWERDLALKSGTDRTNMGEVGRLIAIGK